MASVLWLTSRSTFEKGAGFCPMFRYLRTHAGPYGYGFEPKGQSIPLSTGTYTHAAPEVILRAVMQAQETQLQRFRQVPFDDGLRLWYDELIRFAVDQACQKYEAVIKARGFLDLPEDESKIFTLTLMREQQTLIEGLTWVWALYVLPGILQRGRLVSVEAPEFLVLGCTCGAGAHAPIAAHEARDCSGIVFLAKLDFVIERFDDQQLEYHEFKTSSYGRKNWQEQWERKPQLQTSMACAESRLGDEQKHLRAAYIHGLIKGRRDRDASTNYEGPKKQGTFLCYAYYEDPNPPMTAGDWQPLYKWRDPDGNNRTLGKRYKKQPIWEVGRRGEFDARFPNKLQVGSHEVREDDGALRYDITYQSNVEHWVKALPVEILQKCYQLVGPVPFDPDKTDMAFQAVVVEERLWQQRLTAVYQDAVAQGVGWGSLEFEAILRRHIPRAFNCDPFGSVPCDFVPLCYRHEGWQDPVGSGAYVYRRPHHEAELQQMIARGLEPPAEGLAAEEDEGEEGEW